jgi:hypothetical protein
MNKIDPLEELEKQALELSKQPITEENSEHVLESINSFLHSIDKKLETIINNLTEE